LAISGVIFARAIHAFDEQEREYHTDPSRKSR